MKNWEAGTRWLSLYELRTAQAGVPERVASTLSGVLKPVRRMHPPISPAVTGDRPVRLAATGRRGNNLQGMPPMGASSMMMVDRVFSGMGNGMMG